MGIFPQVFGPFEHKIEVFVLFCLWNRRFQGLRAQNRGFCALLMWDGAQVLAVTIAVAVALTVAKALALTTILAEDLAAGLALDLAEVLA